MECCEGHPNWPSAWAGRVHSNILQSSLGCLRSDVVAAVNSFWSLDTRSLYLLNEALMVLLRNTPNPATLKDYRPIISLIHSFGKLLAKGLAMRLAPQLHEMVRPNQSAFV